MKSISRATTAALLCGALCVMASLHAAGSLPATSPGSPDPAFGDQGTVLLNPTKLMDGIYDGVVLGNGTFVGFGGIGEDGIDGAYPFVVRFAHDGELETTDRPNFAPSVRALFGDDGSAHVVFYVGFRCAVVRVLPNGTIDSSFGEGGPVSFLVTGGPTTCQSVVRVGGDFVLVSGSVKRQDGDHAFFAKLHARTGAFDPTFGASGVAVLPTVLGFPLRVAAAPSGRLAVIGSTNLASGQTLAMLRADGTLDPAFNGTGIVTSTAGSRFADVRFQSDGRAVAVGKRVDASLALWRFNGDGSVDAAFGAGTNTVIPVFETVLEDYVGPVLDIRPNDRIVVALTTHIPSGRTRIAVLRLDAEGRLDPGFGKGGSTILRESDEDGDDLLLNALSGSDGKIWLLAERFAIPNGYFLADSQIAIVRLVGEETTSPVIEFHNATLDHYFVTADAAEAQAIDAGSAGPGWTRTGATWASGGPDRACRFAGNATVDPATGRPRGPNSHFYSLDPAECGATRGDPAWQFESYDFSAWPASDRTCREATVPMLRLYNNGFARNDSNHRYTADRATYDAMIGQGWIGEGVVFCVNAGP